MVLEYQHLIVFFNITLILKSTKNKGNIEYEKQQVISESSHFHIRTTFFFSFTVTLIFYLRSRDGVTFKTTFEVLPTSRVSFHSELLGPGSRHDITV